jgi:hypothetical protein
VVAGKFRHQAADGGIIITNNQRGRLLEMAKIKYRIARLGFDTRPAATARAYRCRTRLRLFRLAPLPAYHLAADHGATPIRPGSRADRSSASPSRALAMLLFDEATSALDSELVGEVLTSWRTWRKTA